MQFKDISYLQSGSQLVRRSKIIKAILLERFIRNISVKLFGICTSVV